MSHAPPPDGRPFLRDGAAVGRRRHPGASKASGEPGRPVPPFASRWPWPPRKGGGPTVDRARRGPSPGMPSTEMPLRPIPRVAAGLGPPSPLPQGVDAPYGRGGGGAPRHGPVRPEGSLGEGHD